MSYTPGTFYDMDAAASTVNSLPFRRHAQLLSYTSFRHAQGDQRAQIDFIQAYARELHDSGVSLDVSARTELIDWSRRCQLPRGHLTIPNEKQRVAQFEFWWLNTWDILLAVYAGDPHLLPSREQLDARAEAVGGTSDMSSFTTVEMDVLAEGFATYRDDDGQLSRSREVAISRFLPNLIRVEHNFQGRGQKYSRRPREDGGDPHESKLLTYCREALARFRKGAPNLVDHIYLEICRRLDRVVHSTEPTSIHDSYAALVAAYNDHHPDPVAILHVPPSDFPAR